MRKDTDRRRESRENGTVPLLLLAIGLAIIIVLSYAYIVPARASVQTLHHHLSVSLRNVTTGRYELLQTLSFSFR